MDSCVGKTLSARGHVIDGQERVLGADAARQRVSALELEELEPLILH